MARHHRLNSTNTIHARPDEQMGRSWIHSIMRYRRDWRVEIVRLHPTSKQRRAMKDGSNADRRRRDKQWI